jgi:hypothetical protein
MVRALAAVALATLVVPAVTAAEVRVVRAPLADPIAFAGDALAYEQTFHYRVAFADTVAYGSHVMLRVPGRRPRRVTTLPGDLESIHESGSSAVSWDASASSYLSGAAVTTVHAAGPDESLDVRGGPLAGPFARFAECEGGAYGRPSVAVWEEVGAFADLCSSPAPVVVRRLDDPRAAPERIFPDAFGVVDLAGSYLAVGKADGVEVFDRRDGALVYRVSAELFGEEDERDATFELQEDGKVAAMLLVGAERCDAAWFSPAEPYAHVVGEADCGGDLRLRSDRIAWVEPRRRRAALKVKPLSGPATTVARFPASRPTPGDVDLLPIVGTVSTSFAFDGERLAYSVNRCDGRRTLLLRPTIAGPTFHDRDPLACPFRLRRRTVAVRPGSKIVRLPVHCPRGCAGRITVRRGDYIEQPFAHRAGGGSIPLRLAAATVRRLRRRGHTALPLRIDTTNRLGGAKREVTVDLRTTGR